MSEEKKALRTEMAKRRATAHAQIDATPAIEALIKVLRKATGPISFYWPIRTEIDPRPAMHDLADIHTLCLPVTDGHGPLTFRQWQSGTEMETDGFGVSTPTAAAPEVTPHTLVVPLLAFDADCHRLGYGAGHYDRTIAQLKTHLSPKTIGLAYSAQKLHTPLPIEPTDQPLDLIITEDGTHTPAPSSV